MKLIIVRHADPDYTIDSLTPKGWKEAEFLSQRLSKLDVKDFYVSPMGRAKATASCTLEKIGRTAQEKPWLREFSALVCKPNKEGMSDIAWDWLPEDWTAVSLRIWRKLTSAGVCSRAVADYMSCRRAEYIMWAVQR